MRMLADRAGVVPATLYNLYGGKDELLLAALDDQLEQLSLEALSTGLAPGVDAILGLAVVAGKKCETNPDYTAALARSLFNLKRDDPAVDVQYARARPFFLQHMQIAEAEGQLNPGTKIEVISDHLVGQGWSVIWSWIMGAIKQNNLCQEYERSYLMTLISVTAGATNERLRVRFAELDAD